MWHGWILRPIDLQIWSFWKIDLKPKRSSFSIFPWNIQSNKDIRRSNSALSSGTALPLRMGWIYRPLTFQRRRTGCLVRHMLTDLWCGKSLISKHILHSFFFLLLLFSLDYWESFLKCYSTTVLWYLSKKTNQERERGDSLSTDIFFVLFLIDSSDALAFDMYMDQGYWAPKMQFIELFVMEGDRSR